MLHLDKEKPVLVTGGSGYLASWLVKLLLEQGLTVRITIRDMTSQHKISHLHEIAARSVGKLEVFAADLLVAGSFDAAVEGCELVFHTASPFLLSNITDAQTQLIDPALKGTENVLEAVEKCASVKRVILTSSVVAVMGDNADIFSVNGGQFNEHCWNKSSNVNHQAYSYAKTEAELRAWQLAERQKRWSLVVLNPGFILGPSLTKRNDSASIAFMINMASGRYAFGVPQLYNGVVDVRDVAKAHFLAATNWHLGGRFILVNQTLTLLDIAKRLACCFPSGFVFAKRELPKTLLWLIAPFIDRTRRYVTRNFNIAISFDNRRSTNELNLRYRPIDDTLTEHVQQLVDDGLV